jgi:hypothetical protein
VIIELSYLRGNLTDFPKRRRKMSEISSRDNRSRKLKERKGEEDDGEE